MWPNIKSSVKVNSSIGFIVFPSFFIKFLYLSYLLSGVFFSQRDSDLHQNDVSFARMTKIGKKCVILNLVQDLLPRLLSVVETNRF